MDFTTGENFTADVHPNFNVTQIITNQTGIFLGPPYYNIIWGGHGINANITAFNEGINATFHITSSGTTGVIMNILGNVQQVKLNGANQAFGTSWSYVTINGLSVTQIHVGTNKDIFVSFSSGPIQVTNFLASGYVLANNGVFNNPSITLLNPSIANVTALLLFNQNGQLISFEDISTHPKQLIANVPTTIPVSLQDNTIPIGTQVYYEQAIIETPTSVSIPTSNLVTLNYTIFNPTNLNFDLTNTNTVPIYFIRKDLNTTDTRLSVIYPNVMSMKCNFSYEFAMTNKTYGPPLPFIVFSSTDSNSSFKFHNLQNEIVTVLCTDTISNQTGKYLLTQNTFPFQQQVQDFRNGKFGTSGNFGVFDFVSLGVIIISMIGFNRVNEAVGAFFCISIVGAAAFFGIVTLPTFIIGIIVVVAMLAYTSTRKSGVFG